MKSLFSKTYVAFAIILLAVSGCETLNVPDDVPSCIRNKISDIKAEPVRNPPASIWRYEYKGQTVYFIPSYCCDIPSQLFDSNCNLICNPDGGFSGKGDGKCADFFTNRKNEKLIWKDDRK